MNRLGKFLIATIGCELVGILSTPFTIASIPTWYAILNKPIFSPPNWLFGPVWTILYFLMGVSLFIVWSKNNPKSKIALHYFAAQLIFNFLWSVIFFGLHSPAIALIDILLMWVLILITIIKFSKISKIAAYLLVPYLLWVSFATLLNLAIVHLN